MEAKKAVTIKDTEIWDAYQTTALLYSIDDERLDFLRKFIDKINYYQDSEIDLDEVLNVCEAILHGDEVQLKEPKYALSTKTIDRDNNEMIAFIDNEGFVRTFSAISRHTQAEWDAAFSKTPLLDRDDFKKVYVDE